MLTYSDVRAAVAFLTEAFGFVEDALLDIQSERIGQCAELVAHHFASAGWTFEAERWRRRAALRVTKIELSRRGS